MKRYAFRILIILLLVVATIGACLGLSACNNNKGKVSELTIIANTFRADYTVDEPFDLSKAKLIASFANGEKTEIKVTESMVSGYDSTVCGDGKTLSINYGGKSVTFIYNVSYAFPVTVRTRLRLNAVTGTSGAYSVSIDCKDKEVFAVKFFIYINSTEISNINLQTVDKNYAVKYDIRADKTSFVVYRADGTAFDPQVGLVTLTATATFTVKDIYITDLINDIRLPDVTRS